MTQEIIFAEFLKNEDGDFDLPALILSSIMLFGGIYGLFWLLPRFIRTGKTSLTIGLVGRVEEIEREKNPKLFWTLIVIYFLGSLFSLFGAYVFATGKMRKW
jgi:hypothetical protein